MKILISKHIITDKIPRIKVQGWTVTENQVRRIIRKPRWTGKTNSGQPTAMDLLDKNHILRVVYEHKNGIIVAITIHPARRESYESTQED